MKLEKMWLVKDCLQNMTEEEQKIVKRTLEGISPEQASDILKALNRLSIPAFLWYLGERAKKLKR